MDDRHELSSIRSARASLPDAHGRRVRVVVDSERDDLVVRKTGSSPRAVTAIEREALVLAQLRHPDVVEMLSTERGDGTVTLVTRFAGRSSLANVHPPDVASACRLVAATFRVVDELHALGWVHGRLAPDHCVVDGSGRVTLCALGAAHRASEGDARYADDVSDAVAVAGMVLDRVPAEGRRERRRLRSVRRLLGAIVPDEPATLHAATVALAPFAEARDVADRGDTTRPGAGPDARATSHNRRPWPSGAHAAVPGVSARITPSRGAVAAGAAATLAVLVGCIAGIRRLGGPLTNPFTRDVASTDLPFAVDLAVAVIRIAAIGASLYGIALAAATLAAVATQRPDVARLATRLAPPAFRRTLVVLIGVGILASTASPNAGDATGGPGAPTTSAPTTTSPTTTPAPRGSPVASVDPNVDPADDPAADPIVDPAAVPAPPAPDSLPRLWVIEPGDHLWGVAEQTLAAHMGRPPADTEVVPYWRALIELNRSSLVDRDNPDLVRVGQVVELPPLPPAGP